MIKIQDNALLRLRELRDKHKKNYVRLDVKGVDRDWETDSF